jgi:hypothetical protein
MRLGAWGLSITLLSGRIGMNLHLGARGLRFTLLSGRIGMNMRLGARGLSITLLSGLIKMISPVFPEHLFGAPLYASGGLGT